MLGVAAWAWYYVTNVLAGPVPDAYARTIDFQLLMFAIFRLPLALVFLALVVAAAIAATTAETVGAVEQQDAADGAGRMERRS
jgi:hypothetical protein